jgi:hypothetical protein
MRKALKKYLFIFLVLAFTAICLLLTINKHNNSGVFNYHSEIFGDKSGYYMYLPASFNFAFNPYNFPDSIDKRVGQGFILDYENNKVVSKYTCGVAILQTPFYLMADKLARNARSKPLGFSFYHHKMSNIAAVFYLVLGFIFLFQFLKKHYDYKIILPVLISLFLASNLYYYSIEDGGLSHIYSFAMFSAFLLWNQKTNYLEKPSLWQSFVFGLLCGIIILLRPTNVIFLSSYLFLNWQADNGFLHRLKNMVKIRTLIPALIAMFLVFSPQMLYWHYISGSFVHYSYVGEGFNWFNPKPHLVWFSPNNGLFIYTPFYLVILLSIVALIRYQRYNAMYLGLVFLLITYVFSSWWTWHFGCSFGARSYVEYYALFSLPLASLVLRISKSKMAIAGMSILLILFAIYNLKMTYVYDKCFFGGLYWDWETYLNLLRKAFL